MSRALVLFSGGQDSTTCLAWALTHFTEVETIGFNYGQRHSVEMECRINVIQEIKNSFPNWSSKLIKDHVLDLGLLGQISDCALTEEREIAFTNEGLPNTFVPGRNLIFLTFAATIGFRRGIDTLVGGMCETDYSGYPDCRDTTLQALNLALSLGMERRIKTETPLMWLDKSETWSLAEDLGGTTLIEIIKEHTHTCYLGNRSMRQSWGYGCGTCPACELRACGFEKFSSHQINS